LKNFFTHFRGFKGTVLLAFLILIALIVMAIVVGIVSDKIAKVTLEKELAGIPAPLVVRRRDRSINHLALTRNRHGQRTISVM